MKKHAVLITVLFAFVVTVFSVSIIFWEFYKLNKQQYINNIFTKYAVITQIYREHEQKDSSDIMFEANLAVYKFRIEKNRYIQKQLINKGEVLKKDGYATPDNLDNYANQGLEIGTMDSDLKATMLELNNKIYFYVQTPRGIFCY